MAEQSFHVISALTKHALPELLLFDLGFELRLASLEDVGEAVLTVLLKVGQRGLDVRGNPLVPLEEGNAFLLALQEELVARRLHLNELLLLLVVHDLRQQRHLEELRVGVLPLRLDHSPAGPRVAVTLLLGRVVPVGAALAREGRTAATLSARVRGLLNHRGQG